MQLAVVALVLPPLILLARAESYGRLRIFAASATAVAASGWLAARLGLPNAIADLADSTGMVSLFVVALLWIAAVATIARPPKARLAPAI
jgi:hypothetical protein